MADEQVGGEITLNGRPYILSSDENDRKVVGQLHPSKYPRYAGLSTFCRLPQLHQIPAQDCDIAVLGIPWDAGTSYRPGCRFGPSSIREASRIIRPYHVQLQTTPFGNAQVIDAGDVPCSPFDIKLAIKQMEEYCDYILSLNDRVRLVIMGGDHTISYPVLKSVVKKHGGPVALLHFDAHFDTYPGAYGADVWHGSPFRLAHEENLLDTKHSMHIGIRNTVWGSVDFTDSEEMGFACLLSNDVHRHGTDWTIKQILKQVAGRPVYISIDIDVLDVSVAPATGTPEIGGLFSHQLLEILAGLRDLHIVGCDVMEVAPAYDHAQITALAAAGLLNQLITMMGMGSAKQSKGSKSLSKL